MESNNSMILSGGLLLAVSLNQIYTIIAIIAIALGVISTVVTLFVKLVKFLKDGRLSAEERRELMDESKRLTEELKSAQTQIEELKKKNDSNKEE